MSDEPAVPDPDASDPVDEGAFGIDAFSLDDRLRLFRFAAAEKRHEYLWLLRAFDRGRADYQVLLHVSNANTISACRPRGRHAEVAGP